MIFVFVYNDYLFSSVLNLMNSLLSIPAMSPHPRKSSVLHRTTFLALFSLATLSAYLFLVAKPTLVLSPFVFRRPLVNNNDPPTPHITHKKLSHHLFTQQVHLNQSQELAAVTSFLASLPQNVIPLTVDPAQPIDPQLILDFDTRSSRVSEELEVLIDDVWSQNPVVLYSKVYSSFFSFLYIILHNIIIIVLFTGIARTQSSYCQHELTSRTYHFRC